MVPPHRQEHADHVAQRALYLPVRPQSCDLDLKPTHPASCPTLHRPLAPEYHPLVCPSLTSWSPGSTISLITARLLKRIPAITGTRCYPSFFTLRFMPFVYLCSLRHHRTG